MSDLLVFGCFSVTFVCLYNNNKFERKKKAGALIGETKDAIKAECIIEKQKKKIKNDLAKQN